MEPHSKRLAVRRCARAGFKERKLTNERQQRNDTLEEAAKAVEHMAVTASHAAKSMRTKPCRDRRDEDDYERMAQTFDREKDTLKKAADTIRALKV